jgi:hypothetical protein
VDPNRIFNSKRLLILPFHLVQAFGIVVQVALPIDIVVTEVLAFLDVHTLLLKAKAVYRQWKRMCPLAIDLKRANSGRSKAFETKQELYYAVRRYKTKTPNHAEELASAYGWLINEWDVSNLQNFSCIFNYGGNEAFNDDNIIIVGCVSNNAKLVACTVCTATVDIDFSRISEFRNWGMHEGWNFI